MKQASILDIYNDDKGIMGRQKVFCSRHLCKDASFSISDKGRQVCNNSGWRAISQDSRRSNQMSIWRVKSRGVSVVNRSWDGKSNFLNKLASSVERVHRAIPEKIGLRETWK